MIYHLVPESELRSCIQGSLYLPANLASDGFVHCSSAASVIPVANDYFAGISGRLLLLEVDPEHLASEVRYEAPAPLAGGSSHLAGVPRFPHVYGPINTSAITGVGILGRTAGGYEWPPTFTPLDTFLATDR